MTMKKKNKAFIIFALLVLLAVVTESKRTNAFERVNKRIVNRRSAASLTVSSLLTKQQLIERDQRVLATAFDDTRFAELITNGFVGKCKAFIQREGNHCFATLEQITKFFGLHKNWIEDEATLQKSVIEKGLQGADISNNLSQGATFGMCFHFPPGDNVEHHAFGLVHTTSGSYYIVDSWAEVMALRVAPIAQLPDMSQAQFSLERTNEGVIQLNRDNIHCIVSKITQKEEDIAAANAANNACGSFVGNDPDPTYVNDNTPAKSGCCTIL